MEVPKVHCIARNCTVLSCSSGEPGSTCSQPDNTCVQQGTAGACGASLLSPRFDHDPLLPRLPIPCYPASRSPSQTLAAIVQRAKPIRPSERMPKLWSWRQKWLLLGLTSGPSYSRAAGSGTRKRCGNLRDVDSGYVRSG